MIRRHCVLRDNRKRIGALLCRSIVVVGGDRESPTTGPRLTRRPVCAPKKFTLGLRGIERRAWRSSRTRTIRGKGSAPRRASPAPSGCGLGPPGQAGRPSRRLVVERNAQPGSSRPGLLCRPAGPCETRSARVRAPGSRERLRGCLHPGSVGAMLPLTDGSTAPAVTVVVGTCSGPDRPSLAAFLAAPIRSPAPPPTRPPPPPSPAPLEEPAAPCRTAAPLPRRAPAKGREGRSPSRFRVSEESLPSL